MERKCPTCRNYDPDANGCADGISKCQIEVVNPVSLEPEYVMYARWSPAKQPDPEPNYYLERQFMAEFACA